MERLYLRLATKKDCDLIFTWANDEITRMNSFNTERILYENHLKWFESLLNDDNRKQYILMAADEPIGQVRFDFDGDLAEIGYSIDETNRGLGYGKSIISLAINQLRNEYPYIKKLVAKVKPSNVASIHCFLDNGFESEFNQYSLELSSEHTMIEKPQKIENEAGGGTLPK